MERRAIRDKLRGWSDTGATSFQAAPISSRSRSLTEHPRRWCSTGRLADGVPYRAARASFHDRGHRDPAGTPACHLGLCHQVICDFSGRWKRIKAYFTHRLCCRRRGCQHLGGLFAVALRSVGLRPGGHRRPYLLFQNRYAQPRLLVTVDSLEFGFGWGSRTFLRCKQG